MRSDTSEDPEHSLNKEWRLDQTALGKVRQVVEMADVVALEFKARVVGGTLRQSVFDILEGVAKNQITTRLERFELPGMLELLETRQ